MLALRGGDGLTAVRELLDRGAEAAVGLRLDEDGRQWPAPAVPVDTMTPARAKGD
jgi:hypothetical protein